MVLSTLDVCGNETLKNWKHALLFLLVSVVCNQVTSKLTVLLANLK